jgi:hypothetical protein
MTTITRPLENGHLEDTPVADTLLRRFLHNQADLAALLALAGGGKVHRCPDVVVAAWDTVVPYQSMAVLLRPLDDELADEVDAAFGGRHGMVLSAWPTADMSARGWHLIGHPTFVARGPQPVTADLSSVRRVTTVDGIGTLEDVVARGYPMPEAVGAPVGAAYPVGVLGSDLHLFLGTLDDEVVGAAASHTGHGVLNMCLAATLEPARRRGVWQALAQARLAEHPELPAAAFTSDYSRAGFEKLGFLPVTRFTLWFR